MAKRVFLWDPSNADARCPLSDKIPKAAVTGMSSADRDRELKRLAFVGIVEHLWAHEDDVYACRSFLDERRAASATANDEKDTFRSLSTIGKLDEDFVVAQLLKHTKLTKRGLERAKLYDEQSVSQIFCYMMASAPGVKLPAECRSKTVCDKLTTDRIRKIDRLKVLSDDIIMPNGQIAWHEVGCYRLHWSVAEKPRCIRIEHTLTKAVADVPEHVQITEDYHMEMNWNDLGATVTLHPNKYTLATFFASDSKGPHTISVWSARSKVVNAAAAEAATTIATLRKMATAGEVDTKDGFFQDVVKKRRQDAAAKARQLLDQKKSEMTTKRRIALASPPAKVAKRG